MNKTFALFTLITTLTCQSAQASQQPHEDAIITYYLGNPDYLAALKNLHLGNPPDLSINTQKELQACISAESNPHIQVGSVLHSNGQYTFYIGTIGLKNNYKNDEIIVTIRKKNL